MTLGAV